MITLEQLDNIVNKEPVQKLIFDIPDSIDGSKRKAIFTNLEYYTADDLPTESIENATYLTVGFYVFCYLLVTEEDEYGDPVQVVKEILGRSFRDTFKADYKTYVNGNTGEILAKALPFEPNKQGLVDKLNQLVTDGIYTEQQILDNELNVKTQIDFFNFMFNNADNGGLIPVKDLISSFALTADWKDVQLRTI